MSVQRLEVNGKELKLNRFAEEVIESAIRGLLSPLRGYEDGDILIRIRKRC
ncbi:MAG: hypothetical protein ACE5K0_02130 [Candidatus Methanofastidiosia archaeon]